MVRCPYCQDLGTRVSPIIRMLARQKTYTVKGLRHHIAVRHKDKVKKPERPPPPTSNMHRGGP